MARPGQELGGPASSIRFLETTEQTGGERVVVEVAYRGTADRPPPHLHPSQEERFEVLEGEVQALVEGERLTLRPGATLTVPAGTVHEMWSEAPARQRWETRPALRTERFFETVWGLQAAGRTDANGIPSKAQMALSLRHFAPEFRLASPPPAVQAVAFPILGLVARARGLSPEYPSSR